MNLPRFIYSGLDRKIQDNLEILKSWLGGISIFNFGFKKFEFSVDGAVTNYAIQHSLGYAPTDIIQTYISGNAITFIYAEFTNEYIYVTTTGALRFRGLIGAFRET